MVKITLRVNCKRQRERQAFDTYRFGQWFIRRDGCNAFPQKPDSVINVKVEFGEGEGKGRSDNRYT